MSTNASALSRPRRPVYSREDSALQLQHEKEMYAASLRGAEAYDRSRRPSLATRIGNLAIDGRANTILFADQARARLTGNAAINATEATAPRPQKHATLLDEKLALTSQDTTKKQPGRWSVAAARAHKANIAAQKHQATLDRSMAAHKAVLKYRAEHPEIEERELREAANTARHEAITNLSAKHSSIVEHFQNQRSVYSFSKSIPRRPSGEGQPGFTGDYTVLAKATLDRALAHQTEDGTIPLLGYARSRMAEHEAQGESVYAARDAEAEYTEGAATALWQLGFVQYENENDIAYGHGSYNPAIEWETTKDSVKARIPFDANNALHQMLAPADAGEGQMIELEMSQSDYGYNRQPPYMNMRVVEAAPQALTLAA